jgi:hypothetical protein
LRFKEKKATASVERSSSLHHSPKVGHAELRSPPTKVQEENSEKQENIKSTYMLATCLLACWLACFLS